MAETADYTPGAWSGHDFSSARKAYDVHVGRSYADATTAGKTATDLVPAKLTTNSPAPLIILCDVTGSMGEWPAVIFSKLPYLDIEGKEYLGPDMEICFGAVGDAMSDRYPLQMQPFGRGQDLKASLKELIIEGGGGGQNRESYELAGLYCARNIETPNATKPIIIFIGDEALYDHVTKSTARMAHVDLDCSVISTKQIFSELTQKFSVYVIRKTYLRDDNVIHGQWIELLGSENVAKLEAADRVIDVIFGILAKETGKVDYFKAEIEGRQTPEQVNTVYKSLSTVHVSVPSDGKSRMALPKGKKTKHLLPR